MLLAYNGAMNGEKQPNTPAAASDQPADLGDDAIATTWSAGEYVSHQNSGGWYISVIGFSFGLAFLAYILLKDFFAPALFVLLGVAAALYAKRPPSILQYSVSIHGVTIGEKHHSLSDFRSFSMMEDGGILSIQLNPLRRFLPPISLYLDEKDADRVADAFSMYLPHEEKAADLSDRIARKLRF